ncbi:conserved repeat domain-containing protein [Nonomuraea solani]|uniref:Conserved repeat domain-containing protein n=1 Tax=Nonomuraea solani TaxID=1144553 RepID=A0A1H5UL65_9ACTN|nr:CARDB domain-containing protein [Nonomuraea solani]SEF75813.1 conserved repeat domain-containing protein [Nonomuraea solani]
MGRPGIAAVIALAALSGWIASAVSSSADASRPTPPPPVSGPEQTITPTPVLRIGTSIRPSPLIIGRDSVYAVTVTNAEHQDTAGVTVTITLDQNLTPGRVPVGCSRTNRTITCDALTIPADRSVTYEIPVVTDPALQDGTIITNRAHVTGGPATQLISRAQVMTDLEIAADGPRRAKAGDSVPHTLTVTNHGPSRAQQVTVQSPAHGERSLGALAPDETRTFTYTKTPGTPGLFETCAVVRTGSREENDANNRSCTGTTVRPVRAPAPASTPEPSATPRDAAAEAVVVEEPPMAEPKQQQVRENEPLPAPADVPPPAHDEEQGTLPLTGVSVWALGLVVAVLLSVGLLIGYFSRHEPRREKAGRAR